MKDYEYLFVQLLHQKLKNKIVGKVFVKVNAKDELFVEIQSYGDLTYRLYLGHFSERLLNGWSTEYAVYEIMKQYKMFIMERYFK